MSAARPEHAYRESREAARYVRHHRGSLGRRWRSAQERRFCERVLDRLGHVDSILDVPCGAGRLWPALASRCRRLYAADASSAMLRSSENARGVFATQALAQRLPFADAAVDVVFCHRLLHHYAGAAERRAILAELGRVARRAVVFSLWTTGNWRAFRERRKVERGTRARKRFCIAPDLLAADARAAGLEIESLHHKVRWYSPLALIVARPAGVRRAVPRGDVPMSSLELVH
jgi:SAM-dependent methyltransferase